MAKTDAQRGLVLAIVLSVSALLCLGTVAGLVSFRALQGALDDLVANERYPVGTCVAHLGESPAEVDCADPDAYQVVEVTDDPDPCLAHRYYYITVRESSRHTTYRCVVVLHDADE